MPTLDSEPQAVRRQLERTLASRNFTSSRRLSRFLRFVVERHLEGRDDELKESVIALEVFGNRDYDSNQDSIVRTEAGRLRARLAEYYGGEGRADTVIIEVPKGGYIPVFRRLGGTGSEPKTQIGRLWLTVALAGLGVVLAAAGWWLQHREAPIRIAVLPLENLSHDPANDYLADGLTDELIRNLSIIDGLAPRSRTSSYAFRGRPRNVREVGKQLAADYILEGSVLRAGQQLRINVQLIRVRDDFPLWVGRFDGEVSDVLAIQEEISRGIVNHLRLKLGRGRRRYETSAEAYDLYLRARALPIRHGLSGYQESIGPFEQAIAKDPSFAPAYAGLAVAYATNSHRFIFLDRLTDGLAKMRAAAEKAIQLDPLLAEAHDARALVYARDGRWEEAEKSFRHAIELDPNDSISYHDFAVWLLEVLGRHQEALQQLRIAEKIDPLSPEVHYVLAEMLSSLGRYDEAASLCQKLPADHFFKIECLGRARIGQGRIQEAIQILAAGSSRGFLGYAYGRTGRREEAEKLAADLSSNPFQQVWIFAGLSDKDRTLEALDRMSILGPQRIGMDLSSPELGFLRDDPRAQALRKKVGLPEQRAISRP
jgi:TolB-like protein/Tfp pilus assembly protein PilF